MTQMKSREQECQKFCLPQHATDYVQWKAQPKLAHTLAIIVLYLHRHFLLE